VDLSGPSFRICGRILLKNNVLGRLRGGIDFHGHHISGLGLLQVPRTVLAPHLPRNAPQDWGRCPKTPPFCRHPATARMRGGGVGRRRRRVLSRYGMLGSSTVIASRSPPQAQSAVLCLARRLNQVSNEVSETAHPTGTPSNSLLGTTWSLRNSGLTVHRLQVSPPLGHGPRSRESRKSGPYRDAIFFYPRQIAATFHTGLY